MSPSGAGHEGQEGPGQQATDQTESGIGLGRCHKAWTPREDEYLKLTFRKLDARDIASNLGRTRSAVCQRALKALTLPRIRNRPRGRTWEPAEEELLREDYRKRPTAELAGILMRTPSSIHARALLMGLTKEMVPGPYRRWTEEDERYLLTKYKRFRVKEIANHLDRSASAVRVRAQHPRWGQKAAGRRARVWLATEDTTLRSDYRAVPTKSIARVLGRTIPAINSRAHKMGLTRHFKRSPRRSWTEEEDDALRTGYGKVRPQELAGHLGRSRPSVYHRAETLGLSADLGSPEYFRRQSLPRTAAPFTGLADPTQLGYVAGIVDGEGSIVGPPKVTVQVSMTTREVIAHLHRLCGGSATGPYEKRSGRAEVCLPQYHWTVSSAESVYRLLKVLLPHLIVKKHKALEVIQFLERKWSA